MFQIVPSAFINSACKWTLVDDCYMRFDSKSTTCLTANKWKDFFELLGLGSFTTLKKVVKTLHKSDLVSSTLVFMTYAVNVEISIHSQEGILNHVEDYQCPKENSRKNQKSFHIVHPSCFVSFLS